MPPIKAQALSLRVVELEEEVDDMRREITRREGYIWTLENRIEAAKLALGGHPAADVLFDTERTS